MSGAPLPPAEPITIIAVHGNGGGGSRFERVLPFMPGDVALEAITLPGFAALPPDPALRTMADYARAIDRHVSAFARPRVLLGTGIGGSFALEYLQHYADRIDGVILHAPVGTRLDQRRFPALMRLPGMRAFGQWLFSARLTRPLFKRLLFLDHRRIPADYLRRFFDEYRQCRVFGQMFDLITADWFNALQPCDVPSALLWGERERVLKADHAGDYQRLLTRSVVRIVPQWDHFPMIEQPEEYAREISALARQLVYSVAMDGADEAG